MRIVKKYSNRRLYDTDESRYITLDELAELVRAGSDVFIQDAKTGADLTQATLAQVILESRGGGRLLPVPLLVQMIRMGDDALAEFLGRYMSWAMELYMHAKQGSSALFPLNPLAQLPFTASNALARVLMGERPWGARRDDKKPSPARRSSLVSGPSNAASSKVAPPPPSEPAIEVEGDVEGESEEPDEAPVSARPEELRTSTNTTAEDVAELRRELEALKRSLRSRTRKEP